MDINSKLQEFSESIEELVNKDYSQIEQNIEIEIKESIEQELAEYEAKKETNYNKMIQKIEKDYNKKVFNYEMQCKKDIIDEEKRLKNQIKNEAIERLKKYTENHNYIDFLNKCIKERISENIKYRPNNNWFNTK